MKILAFESSCDETAVAVVENGRNVLTDQIFSQADLHALYGGVVPEIASRSHVEVISRLAERAVQAAGIEKSDIDAVAATYAPGLIGTVLVGLNFAKAAAMSLGVPLIPVHHIKGHVAANYIAYPELEPPFLCLAISGGNTLIIDVRSYTDLKVIGATRDDAAGECFDKTARVLGLPYPGGPQIDKLAAEGRPVIDFPRALEEKGNYEFSFSGLKSAVLNYINSERMKGHELAKADIAASFQASVVEVLVHKAFEAVAAAGLSTLVLAGGVAANSGLEARLREEAARRRVQFYFPDRILCTDNAAMIGCRGYYQAQAGEVSDLYLNAVPGLGLSDR